MKMKHDSSRGSTRVPRGLIWDGGGRGPGSVERVVELHDRGTFGGPSGEANRKLRNPLMRRDSLLHPVLEEDDDLQQPLLPNGSISSAFCPIWLTVTSITFPG